ncbi:MAG TPA: sigma-70 family RNA polymerase sigma factor [Cyclobacteriaceae bacterium]
MTASEYEFQLASLSGMLKTFTKRFTANVDESSDLVQDTLLKALTYRDRFRDDVNLKGWLFTIMRNIFINDYRKNKRRRTSNDYTEDLYFLNVKDEYTFNVPDASIEYKETCKHIELLREDFRIPFKMYTSGYKYHEIAECLEIPIGTIKNRIFNARKEIQKRLADS